ncbi:MAG: cytochrome P450 [Cytobacillus gottheilii]|uniref:cytochrome P450 n=1 Tax=Cytobacillus gottheilii TaxID=859144 RepID=UPI0034640658
MTEVKHFPKEEGLDHSLDLLKEGYLFITNRSTAFQSDIFETRLLGERVICLRGREAAALFYDPQKFKREGASPNRIQKTLLGKKGVQTLDDEAHHHRKAMFMSLMTPVSLQRMRALIKKEWDIAAKKFSQEKEIILYDEAKKVLCRAACDWAGVPLKENDVEETANLLGLLFETPAALGPKHWQGRHARTKLEKWLKELVIEVRNGNFIPPEDKSLFIISNHRQLDGELLDADIAAVELLNILRPIVAVAVYICFTALAVFQHPKEAGKLRSNDENLLQNFVQEVRRFYPFFPFAPARVKADFTWNGNSFEENTLTLLDLYGTNHHPKLWDNPELFQPNRFSNWKDSPFSFIPQGGGDYDFGHRCAGEWVTIEIMKETLNFLVNKISFAIPDQDLSYSFNDIPALPHSKIIMKEIHLK